MFSLNIFNAVGWFSVSLQYLQCRGKILFQYLHCRERVLKLKKDNKWECGRGADRGSTVDDVTTGGVYISGKSTKVGMLEKLTLEKSRKKNSIQNLKNQSILALFHS